VAQDDGAGGRGLQEILEGLEGVAGAGEACEKIFVSGEGEVHHEGSTEGVRCLVSGEKTEIRILQKVTKETKKR
jgi:hypothetical protein